MKKYELLKNDTINIFESKLYRIRRLSDGKLGGYIASEKNLSHKGTCWVYDNAKVFQNAKIFDDARIFDDAMIYGNSRVSGKSCVGDSAKIYNKGKVYNDGWVYGSSIVCENARVSSKKECINIIGLPFNITITRDHTRIGCQQKTHIEWINTTEEEAQKMGLDKKYYLKFSIILNELINYVIME